MWFLIVYMGIKIMSIPELESCLSPSLSTHSLKTSAGRRACCPYYCNVMGLYRVNMSCSLEWWMKNSWYCWNTGKICTVVMLNEMVTVSLGRNDWQKRVLLSPSLKTTRSFSISLANLKKIILDSSGSWKWGERIVKDYRIAPENRMMGPLSERKKKSANVENFLVDDYVGEAMLLLWKHLNIEKLHRKVR